MRIAWAPLPLARGQDRVAPSLKARSGGWIEGTTINRREFAGAALASLWTGAIAVPGLAAAASASERWQRIDAIVAHSWAKDVNRATEAEVRRDSKGKLLFLPFPYVSPSPAGTAFAYMFAWDTDFVNLALLAQGQAQLVKNHILNYLSMIERLGYMPNANTTDVSTRSQIPLIGDSVWRYHAATGDLDILRQAYPLLKRNYLDYWTSGHHQTPTGLSTNWDSGDPYFPAMLAAQAETLDWTPIYGADVRRCVPLITNCALVRYAMVIARIARTLGQRDEAKLFETRAQDRAALIRRYCWNEEAGLFLEYDYVSRQQLPFRSLCAYWTLWAGVATPRQALRLVGNLNQFEHDHGLSSTDKAYALPLPVSDYGPPCAALPEGRLSDPGDPRAIGGHNVLQWMYPAGWAPEQMIVTEGLERYGFDGAARRIAGKFLAMLLDQFERTGHFWERYNVVDGSVVVPNARCGNLWLNDWSAAAVAVFGRKLYRDLALSIQPPLAVLGMSR
jgi:alpha,alpha-trehalase